MDARNLLKGGYYAVITILLSVLAGSCGSFRSEFGPGRYEVWSFDKSWPGSVPKGWKIAETAGAGKPAKWQVIHDSGAASGTRAVAITANENRGQTFNLLIAENTSYRSVHIRVMVKAISGEEDQGGGPIWRAKDADNYYIARWNPLEDNFRVYSSRRANASSSERPMSRWIAWRGTKLPLPRETQGSSLRSTAMS